MSRKLAMTAMAQPQSLPILGRERQPFPLDLQPPVAARAERLPEGAGWVHEPALDGCRLLARLQADGDVTLLNPDGDNWSARFPQLQRALARLRLQNTVFDGEVVVLDGRGACDRAALEHALQRGDDSRLLYFVFDLPYYDGYDLRNMSLVARKRLLAGLLRPTEGAASMVRYRDHLLGRAEDVFNHACRQALPAIVSKWAQSPYTGAGARHWVRLDCRRSGSFVVGGWLPGIDGAAAKLLLGYYDRQGLRYCGHLAEGAGALTAIAAPSNELGAAAPPFYNPPGDLGIQWLHPQRVIEVEFYGWSKGGLLRHPRACRDLPGQPPRSVEHQQLAPVPAERAATVRAFPAPVARRRAAGIRLTHPDRVLYPEQGLTKQQLADYYEIVAQRMLPFIESRPLTLVRCPRGARASCFLQTQFPVDMPRKLHGLFFISGEGNYRHAVVRDPWGLLFLVQLGVLEIHPWNVRIDRPHQPDRMVFDVRAERRADTEVMVRGARELRDCLELLRLQSFVRTTGAGELQVVVPLERSTWEDVTLVSQRITEVMASVAPGRYLAGADRGTLPPGTVCVDARRNAQRLGAIANYSTRARPGAPVALPLSWQELNVVIDADEFTPATVELRILQGAPEPWTDFFAARRPLDNSVRRKLALS